MEGHLISSELEPGKVARARANLDAAGLGDLVDIREGDALETLKDVGGEVDLLLIDGGRILPLPAGAQAGRTTVEARSVGLW
jgi:predicted O-methyltransferase YrrM